MALRGRGVWEDFVGLGRFDFAGGRRGSGRGAHADLSDLGRLPGHLASFGLACGGEGPGVMLVAA